MHKTLLRHIAFIMDGNGRWAEKRGLQRIDGHRKGAETAGNIIDYLIKYGIPYVTLYVFSTENWERPQSEVEALFSLLLQNLNRGLEVANEKNARIIHLGSIERLPKDIWAKIQEAVEKTRMNHGITVCLAFNYGGRTEIVEAVRKIVKERVNPEIIDEKVFASYLYTANIPDPDLIIRTGGEMRLSNFLLWQSAYSEIYFTPVLWPDFDQKELDRAIDFYQQRQRRFGRLLRKDVKS